MTNYDTMPAGVEMDRLVAEALLAHAEWFVSSPRSDNAIVWRGSLWMPSMNIADAFQVVLMVRERGQHGHAVDIATECIESDGEIGWHVEFLERGGAGLPARGEGLTLPIAICRAALAVRA